MIAAGNLDRLRNQKRLRPWLYAVTRNLCLRKLRAEKAVAAEWADIDFAPEGGEDSDIGGEAERAELRALLRAPAAASTQASATSSSCASGKDWTPPRRPRCSASPAATRTC